MFVFSISYYKNVNLIFVYLSSTIPNATCHLLSTKVMFLFHNTTPGGHFKLHECFSINLKLKSRENFEHKLGKNLRNTWPEIWDSQRNELRFQKSRSTCVAWLRGPHESAIQDGDAKTS